MTSDELKEILAERLYLTRHPQPEFPSWQELHSVKTYKLRKYRELAQTCIDALNERGMLKI